MSLDPSSFRYQSASPTSSGRSSPVNRPPRRQIEDGIYKKDKSFRRYAAGVERALALFDSPQQDWADYISFLGRLLKAIQANPADIPIVPHKETVSTRLAQCLKSSLPSGVHQKSIEVYAQIFSILGKDNLARDLPIYFPGLSSILSFANLAVRPAFLSLFETFILELDPHSLRPALKSIVLCLLPGLEEETSEDFDRILHILDSVKSAVNIERLPNRDTKSESGDSYFWQCFFLATITNASRRQGALAYLSRRLPRLIGSSGRRLSLSSESKSDFDDLPPAAEAAISPEPGLFVRCFAAGLSDAQLLVQRGFLDLLVTHVPFDSPVLQVRISDEDMDLLITSAVGVVTRRDMSLNRRLWAWFLGPEPASGAEEDSQATSPAVSSKIGTGDPSSYHLSYFTRYGFRPLTRCIKAMISRHNINSLERARPFRICLSLMDRWEVGGLIVPQIFVSAMESVFAYSKTATKEQLSDVLKSANIFFDGVESGLIWGKLCELITSAFSPSPKLLEDRLSRLNLVKFIFTRFNVTEEEMVFYHIPLTALLILLQLENLRPTLTENETLDVLSVAFDIVDSLIQIIPDKAFDEAASKLGPISNKSNHTEQTPKALITNIRSFYEDNQGNLDISGPPISVYSLGQAFLSSSARLFVKVLNRELPSKVIETCTRIFSSVMQKVPDHKYLYGLDIDLSITALLDTSSNSPPHASFSELYASTVAITLIQSLGYTPPLIDLSRIPRLFKCLVREIWRFLSPFTPKYHVEAVRCLCQLHTSSPSDRLVEASITSVLISENNISVENCMRFTVLWNHTMHEKGLQTEKGSRYNSSRRTSGIPIITNQRAESPMYDGILTRPLLLMLDTLAEEGSTTFAFVKTWLQELPSLPTVFAILLSKLRDVQILKSEEGSNLRTTTRESGMIIDDQKKCLYYLQHLLNIVRWSSGHTWSIIASEMTSSLNMDSVTTGTVSLQVLIVQICMRLISNGSFLRRGANAGPLFIPIQRAALSVLQIILQNPNSSALKELTLEIPLIDRLNMSLNEADSTLQGPLLDAAIAALKVRFDSAPIPAKEPHQRKPSKDLASPTFRANPSSEQWEKPQTAQTAAPPSQLVESIRAGFASPYARLCLDKWVDFLAEVLPLYADTIFQNLLPLVECFCGQIGQVFDQFEMIFRESISPSIAPEPTLISLMNGLEQILASAHQRLLMEEAKSIANRSPEQPQGFFGNMVSGVFSAETNQSRSTTANSRLTVILCFQDTVRICFKVWSWASYGSSQGQQDPVSLASYGYTSIRMRNRARRMLEHLFAAESLECLETLAVVWRKSSPSSSSSTAVLGLLNVLDGSRPKNIIPAIFDAVYSRTNPSALDAARTSSLTSDLADTDLVAFLVDYTRSLEDDAMDDIWPDCLAFLRDVLTNPLPHRQVLPILLDFTAMLAEKVDNTNFGEQKKMRKELGDIFMRLLTATFTTRSLGYLQETPQSHHDEKGILPESKQMDVVALLSRIVPRLQLVLVDNDRIASAAGTISSNVISPAIRAKTFPENMSRHTLDLMYQVARVTHSSKVWKKDVLDAFNDPRFFSTPTLLAKELWLPILQQWTLSDKERMPELLSRISAPTTAGIMFGVGATSARLEADRRTQLNLKRIAVIILAAAEDTFTTSLSGIEEKLVELLSATPISSPSSATRAEVFILLRALVLRTSPIHLAALWPLITAELQAAIRSTLPDASAEIAEKFANAALLQGCKLLDALVTLAPDDFQLHEWLFVTDTIDAVYHPPDWRPIAAVDEVAEALGEAFVEESGNLESGAFAHGDAGTGKGTFIGPILDGLRNEVGDVADLKALSRTEFVARVLRPFFGSLSIGAFEATYKMGGVEGGLRERRDAAVQGLLEDLFDRGV
ncbi:hypothetical protein M501DRAFT_1031628 [Patellaria atrata CBS 101060]|uniref:Dopey N-terminal domain-containing protein n=1 Tax=Patellaria atrata CBS 101060 TaxID=1346257 RepID=A0A9P4SB02_9PEZI|nr:hypothetical protein M501DRAFT_1031628 [Patellaria atrata CBS 101060]